MTHQDFETLLDEIIETTKAKLKQKSSEYSSADDKLANFRDTARSENETMAQALWGMMAKQMTSLRMMVKSGKQFSIPLWEEKLGDARNYLILLEAIVKENNQPNKIELFKE